MTAKRAYSTGVPVSLLINIAVAFGVLSSPYGSVLIFDDSFGPGSIIAPLAAGAFAGVLQSWWFGTRPTLVAATVTAILGASTFVFLYPAAMCSVGCVFGVCIAYLGTFRVGGHTRVLGQPHTWRTVD